MSDDMKAVDPVGNFLSQYGVPGMKWGRRNSRGPAVVRVKTVDGTKVGTATAAPGVSKRQLVKAVKNDPNMQLDKSRGKSAQAPGHNKPANTLRANPKNRKMTDAELRAKVNRLQLEKQLADLSQGQKKADSFVKGLLKDTGKQVAREVTRKVATAALQVAIEKAAGKAVAGSTNQLVLQAMANSGGKKKGNK